MITDIVAEQRSPARSTANAYGDDADVPRMNGISVSVSVLEIAGEISSYELEFLLA
ncbi:hypothetical protein HN011_011168, partial [Eciton burchellii]